MLYEFHRQQNAKKPGTVHATYLLSGTKIEAQPVSSNGVAKDDGEDTYMQSSPFMSSMPQREEDTGSSSTLTITLAREEDLDGKFTYPKKGLMSYNDLLTEELDVKAQYESITAIHVYSLAPHPLKDIQLLSDSMRELQTLTTADDPVTSLPLYGIITNPLCKRRPNRRPLPAAPKPAPPVAKKAEAIKPKDEPNPTAKVENKASQSTAAKDFFAKGKEKAKPAGSGTGSGTSSKEGTPAPPAGLKRENSSLFKSFAKAKPKKLAAEDVSMKGMSMDTDEEEEEEVVEVPKKKQKKGGSKTEKADDDDGEGESQRKSRKEKQQAELRKMMEESDEEESPTVAIPVVEPEEEVVEEEPAKEEEPTVTVSGGRRRGRRRVMRKKTVQDEEGYLGKHVNIYALKARLTTYSN